MSLEGIPAVSGRHDLRVDLRKSEAIRRGGSVFGFTAASCEIQSLCNLERFAAFFETLRLSKCAMEEARLPSDVLPELFALCLDCAQPCTGPASLAVQHHHSTENHC